jgi:colicin import membrane protein
MIFSEQEFYQKQHQDDRRWGRAINLAVIFHAVILVSALYLPNIFDRKPLLDEVLTIDLVSMPESPVEVEKPPEPVERHEPAPEPKPVQPPPEPADAVPIEVSAKPVLKPEPEPLAEVKPISIHPLKRKVKKAKDTRLEEEKLREQHALELKRRQREQQRARQKALARARAQEKQAKDAARRARAEVASVIREQQRFHAARPATRGGRGNKTVQSAFERQYYMDLAGRVQRLWILPEIKKWSPSLETIVEFTVLQDGRLVNVKVAKSSGDAFFDRFARETVKKAAPMPPFPPVLKKKRIDLGFRLRPAGVQH